jgi:hypothetical protein
LSTLRVMEILALIVSLVSLGFAAVAYWRCCGKQNPKRTQLEIEHLKTSQKELAESMSQNSASSSAQNIEEGLAVRVRRVEARSLLLRVKTKVNRAISAAAHEEFFRAEELLEDGTELLRGARETLVDDSAYDQSFEEIRNAMRDAVGTVKMRALDVRRRMEQVLAEADHIVDALESDEQMASDHAPTAPSGEAKQTAA